MSGLSATEITDRPLVSFVAFALVGFVLYLAFGLAFDGPAPLAEAAGFAVAFAGVLVGFSVLRRRWLQ